MFEMIACVFALVCGIVIGATNSYSVSSNMIKASIEKCAPNNTVNHISISGHSSEVVCGNGARFDLKDVK